MLSIGLGSAAEYYLREQQSYYLENGEPPGRWFAPHGTLGLVDSVRVDPAIFRALHAGFDPNGTPLVQNAGDHGVDRVGGIDATFSAPKGVSLLWAGAEPSLRQTIETVHDRAVRRALELLDQRAAFTRRGRGGSIIEPTHLVAALFQHGEARPETHADGTVFTDPELHTHADILNVGPRSDGSWGALDARALLAWKMAAGAVYRAELASGLLELGFSVEIVGDRGLFDIAGVPASLKEYFSARRTAIEAALANDGAETATAPDRAARAALATRRSKTRTLVAQDRHALWREKAAEQACDLATLAETLRATGTRLRATDRALRVAPELLREVTLHESVFSLAELYAALAANAVVQGAGLDEIDTAVAHLRAEGRILSLETDARGMERFSTPEMLRIEREVRDRAAGLDATRFAAIDRRVAEAAARGVALSAEQIDAVLSATDARSIAVVEGAAGAGKSTALSVASQLYRTAGNRVIGMATAWRIANQLGADCDIESKATADWLTRAAAGEQFLDSRTVLIVDEAGQLSARQMRAILAEARGAGAKIILTGDSRQLQPIEAGPGLRLVLEAAPGVRVDQIRRQREPWMRDVVRNLMQGRTEKALTALDERGRIAWGKNQAAAVDKLVVRWAEDRKAEPDASTLIVARSHAELRAINERVRAHLRNAGEIGPDLITVESVAGSTSSARIPLAVGDRIRFVKKIRAYGVINGTEARVEDIRQDRGRGVLTAAIGERRVEIDLGRIADARGRVPIAHSASATISASQGATVDRVYVLGSPSFGREEAYVALSRARAGAELFLDSSAVEALEKRTLSGPKPAPLPPADRLERLARRWAKARGKSSALGLAQEHGVDRTSQREIELVP